MVARNAWTLLVMAGLLAVSPGLGFAQDAKAKQSAKSKVKPAVLHVEETGTAKGETIELGTAKPSSHAVVEAPAACCSSHKIGFCHRVWNWLTYRPLRNTHVCGSETRCTPPLFVYFLEHCPVTPGCGHKGPPVHAVMTSSHAAAPKSGVVHAAMQCSPEKGCCAEGQVCGKWRVVSEKAGEKK